MKYSLKIFSIFGIPIELHLSFLLLILVIYAVTFFYKIPILVAILVTLIFVTVVIHELSHSYVAQMYGVAIKRIVLLPIGGVSQMEEIPRDPHQELRIAIAGPLTNFVIAVICFILLLIIGTDSLTLSSVFIINIGAVTLKSFLAEFLGVNLILGAFNLLPAFPMDGGRVLRAFLAERMSYIKATEMAANIGKQFAILMAITGIFINIFLILIALFVYMGAEQEYRAVLTSILLEKVYVRDIMTKNVDTFSQDISVSDALSKMFQQKHMGYPVEENENVVGIVTFEDISKIPENKRNIPVKNIMTKDPITSTPEEHVDSTFQKLSNNDIGRLPVVKNGKLVGIISRTDIMRALNMLKAKAEEEESVIPPKKQ